MDDLFSVPANRDRALTRAEVAQLASKSAPSHLIDCDLEEVDLSGLELAGWTFERCNLRNASFNDALLERSIWRSCRAAFSRWEGVDLGDATISACDLNNATMRSATLTGASFVRCKLTGADLSDARLLDVRFDETLLVHARLPGVSFRKQTLRKIDFGQADLRKCDFRAATLEDCSLRDANLEGARFDGADLRGADLGGLRLVDAAQFRGATISREQASQLLGEWGLDVR